MQLYRRRRRQLRSSENIMHHRQMSVLVSKFLNPNSRVGSTGIIYLLAANEVAAIGVKGTVAVLDEIALARVVIAKRLAGLKTSMSAVAENRRA